MSAPGRLRDDLRLGGLRAGLVICFLMGVGVALAAALQPSGRVALAGGAFLLGVGAIPLPLALLEARARRSGRRTLGWDGFFLAALAILLVLLVALQALYLDGVLEHGSFRGGLARVDDVVRDEPAVLFLGCAVMALPFALMSTSRVEGGASTAIGGCSLGLAALLAPVVILGCVPIAVIALQFGLLAASYRLADRLEARLLDRGAGAVDFAARVASGALPPAGVWLLAHLEHAGARRHLADDAPEVVDDLRQWCRRLERAGGEPCQRAALAAAQALLPHLVERHGPLPFRALFDAAAARIVGGEAAPLVEPLVEPPPPLRLAAPARRALEALDEAANAHGEWAAATASRAAATVAVAAAQVAGEEAVRASIQDELLAWLLPPDEARPG